MGFPLVLILNTSPFRVQRKPELSPRGTWNTMTGRGRCRSQTAGGWIVVRCDGKMMTYLFDGENPSPLVTAPNTLFPFMSYTWMFAQLVPQPQECTSVLAVVQKICPPKPGEKSDSLFPVLTEKTATLSLRLSRRYQIIACSLSGESIELLIAVGLVNRQRTLHLFPSQWVITGFNPRLTLSLPLSFPFVAPWPDPFLPTFGRTAAAPCCTAAAKSDVAMVKRVTRIDADSASIGL